MEIELLKTVANGGGSVVVCVALVVLFLQHVNAIHETNRTVTKDLTDKVFDIAEKTTSALGELKSAIIELQAKMK
jgi:hypothetical protein